MRQEIDPLPIESIEIELPDNEPITTEELARRSEVVERILRRRSRMKPLGTTAGELVREVRDQDAS